MDGPGLGEVQQLGHKQQMKGKSRDPHSLEMVLVGPQCRDGGLERALPLGDRRGLPGPAEIILSQKFPLSSWAWPKLPLKFPSRSLSRSPGPLLLNSLLK